MSIYDANGHFWSGLFSANKPGWQAGLRSVSRRIGDMQFHPSENDGTGYEGWEKVADAAIKRKAKALCLGGHSNGVFAITSIAQKVKPHGIKCYLIAFDKTLKTCPKVGGNVPAVIEIWAQLSKLSFAPDFSGRHEYHNFGPESHLSVIDNKLAQALAVDFGQRFKPIWSNP